MLETVITVYYTTPVIIAQLLICAFLWKLTRDGRTWGLLVVGSVFSLFTRYAIFFPNGIPEWVDDCLRATAITINTAGFFSLYFLLKNLVKKRPKIL